MAIEHFINILIIDDNPILSTGLKEIISGAGNNVLHVKHYKEALPLVKVREIGIILINLDSKSFYGVEILTELKNASITPNTYCLLITQSSTSASKMIKGLNSGAIDFISAPFNPNLVKAKVNVFKTLFYKDQRIFQLLQNIFPMNVLEDLNTYGKFSPKRIDNGVVLFTDFVDFSSSSKEMDPIELLRQLEKYFTVFDQIIKRYQLEKIKTIGDAYMALGGVTETKSNPAVRACLAALEIQNYIDNLANVSKALDQAYWEIRIGIHMGPLVAGIIGSTKFSFDVWGDTVNVAARAERVSTNGDITITESVYQEVKDYLEVESRGIIDILKRGGEIEMYYLKGIKPQYQLHHIKRVPGAELRKLCDLSTISFHYMRSEILDKLKALLPEELNYHDLSHTLKVEKAAMRYARLEGVYEDDLLLLRTAALYHDAGFIVQYDHNEDFAIEMAQQNLSFYGYTNEQIEIVCNIINATKSNVKPKTLLEKIMRDADHDYLGRADYRIIAERLREELEVMKNLYMDDAEWVNFQLNYLINVHRYFTGSAINLRVAGKEKRIQELKNQLKKLV